MCIKKTVNKVLIIDDVTYLPWDPHNVPGKKFFHATDPKEVMYSEKLQPKTNFFKKSLIWQAIEENGSVSEPFVSEGTISAEVYLKECIQARLLPFIDKYYDCSEISFWPDLASAHYADKVISFLNDSSSNLFKNLRILRTSHKQGESNGFGHYVKLSTPSDKTHLNL